MLLLPPTAYRRRRGQPRRRNPAAPPGPAALTLVAAFYEAATVLRLTFDRAIDISAVDGNAILVFDGDAEDERFKADAPGELVGPATVEFSVLALGAWSG